MVIQRWQSVLLLVSAVMMGLASFSTLAQISSPEFVFNFSALGVSTVGAPESGVEFVSRNWMILTLTLLGGLLSAIDIFLFRNLKLQMKVALVTLLVIITACVAIVAGVYQFAEGASVVWQQTCCAPLLALVAVIMAWQRMNADRKKIASSERFI